jgi:hypothetical protein
MEVARKRRAGLPMNLVPVSGAKTQSNSVDHRTINDGEHYTASLSAHPMHGAYMRRAQPAAAVQQRPLKPANWHAGAQGSDAGGGSAAAGRGWAEGKLVWICIVVGPPLTPPAPGSCTRRDA